VAIIAIMIVVVAGLGGYLYAGKIKERAAFYASLVAFSEYLLINVRFSNIVLGEVIDKFAHENKSFAQFFCDVKGRLISSNFNDIMPKFLTLSEKEEVNNFLTSIGKFDLAGLEKNISFYKERFKSIAEVAALDVKKKVPLIEKISLGAGIALAIMII